MTPEQTAREWSEKAYPKRPHSLDLETVVYNSRQEVLQEAAIKAYREALTSLLDEFPEPVDMQCSTKAAQIAYREKIKTIIQNKIK